MQPSALTPKSNLQPLPIYVMRNICTTSKGIKKLLQNLKPNKAAGQDEVRPMVLKKLALFIAPVLYVIFTRSLSTHTVPNDWKMAMITAVFKKGDKDSPTNYCPILLTCICSNTLSEHIITSCMCPTSMSITSYTTYTRAFVRVIRWSCSVLGQCVWSHPSTGWFWKHCFGIELRVLTIQLVTCFYYYHTG